MVELSGHCQDQDFSWTCVVSKSKALLWRYSSPLFHNLKTSFPPDEPLFILCVAFSLIKSPFVMYGTVMFHTGLFVFIKCFLRKTFPYGGICSSVAKYGNLPSSERGFKRSV